MNPTLYTAPVAAPLLDGKSEAVQAKIVGIIGPKAKPERHQSAIITYFSCIDMAPSMKMAPSEAQAIIIFPILAILIYSGLFYLIRGKLPRRLK